MFFVGMLKKSVFYNIIFSFIYCYIPRFIIVNI